MRDKIVALILSTLSELNEDLDIPALENLDEDTRLYGAKSGLDSIALVTLIAELEDRIGDEFGKDIVLADDRAMSQTRSPFRRVGSLADYIEERLKEED